MRRRGKLAMGMTALTWAMVVGCVMASTPATLAAAAVAAATTQAAVEAPPASAELKALLEKVLPELRFDQIGLHDVIDFLRDVTGANIDVDWTLLEKIGVDRGTPVSARLRNVKLTKALEVILTDVGGDKIGYLASGDVIRIMAKEDLSRRAARLKALAERKVPDDAIRTALDKVLPEVRMDAISFSDTIDFLRDITGTNIFVNWKDLEANGTDRQAVVTTRLRSVKFGDALNLILESLPGKRPLDFSVKDNVITIEVAKPPPAQ